MQDEPVNDNESRAPRKPGAGWIAAALSCALAWAAGVATAGYVHFSTTPLDLEALPTLLLFTTAGVVPGVVFFFVAFAAREAARARIHSDRVATLATHATSGKAAVAAVNASRALKGEVAALNQIIGEAGQRLSQLQGALAKDGAALATALARDIQSMRAARVEMRGEAEALSMSVGQNIKSLRDAAGTLKTESAAVQAVFSDQIDAFGKAFATIGARSAEFAAAAETSGEAAETFDHAVSQALAALAHATSLTDSARQAAVLSAEAANGAARAVRESTLHAVNEARQAARAIRAENGRPLPDDSFAADFSGAHVQENLTPPATLASVFDLLRLKPQIPPAPANDAVKGKPSRKQKKAEAAAMEAVQSPAPAPRPAREANLADLVRLAGLSANDVLSANDLARIASAASLDARREAVRTLAAQPVRQISSALRRNREMRQAAELMRRNPARAIGAGTDRALTNAYLLVDAALG
jgi:hypothetical protein